MISTSYVAVISGIIFAGGVFLMLSSRGILKMLYSGQLILAAGLINIVSASALHTQKTLEGTVFGLAVIVIAAVEVMAGLGFIFALHKRNTVLLEDKI